MWCRSINFIYPENYSRIKSDYAANKPFIRTVSGQDRFELSFKAAAHNQFISEFSDLLNQPEKRNIDEIAKFTSNFAQRTGKKPPKIILDSKDTIKKLIKDNYNQNNTDFKKELSCIVNKIYDNEIIFTHGYNADNLVSDYESAANRYHINEDFDNKKDWYKKSIGRIFENIAASAVKQEIIPRIAEKIAREESIKQGKKINPEDIKHQLVQLNNVRLSPIVEFDHVIVRITKNPIKNKKGQDIFKDFEIVGIVETKYSPAQVNYGFNRRVEDICWLKNQTSDANRSCGYRKREYYYQYSKKYRSYMPKGYKCKFKLKRFFDEQTKSHFLFTPESFKRFTTNKNRKSTYENMYFVTSNSLLAFLNEQLAEKIRQDKNLVKTIKSKPGSNTKNPFTPIDNTLNLYRNAAGENPEKDIFKKYLKHNLSKNIVFINDDYFGFSLLSIILYKRMENMSSGKQAPEYLKINIPKHYKCNK